ncbi:uncharacterized protein PpBr36_05948 [Pyricularia pennisetigena]|uniref:uncharacterized protein n=1 Tax=Pyricularia pennisetigena TaxID=1578925 RepID=UPI0011531662|nr:uncharacterized protein PpBr36_05948 [Pyricularia pennisetigena]TLS22715.1 hypothetical protein PpBr36_05948 [Pyricularia pennisetigena]
MKMGVTLLDPSYRTSPLDTGKGGEDERRQDSGPSSARTQSSLSMQQPSLLPSNYVNRALFRAPVANGAAPPPPEFASVDDHLAQGPVSDVCSDNSDPNMLGAPWVE